jgi:hypothetical protein
MKANRHRYNNPKSLTFLQNEPEPISLIHNRSNRDAAYHSGINLIRLKTQTNRHEYETELFTND